MLMIGIINELLRQVQSQPSQSIAYFLCQATDPRLNNATGILRSLIYLLVRQQPHLITHLRERYDTDPELFESGNTIYSLSTIFDKMVQSSTRATIFLLIDGLDECEKKKPFQKKGTVLEQVKEQLRQKSDGTFLWVSLVIQEMQNCQLLSEMVDLLEKAPRGLTLFYNRMLLQIQRLERLKRESCMLVLSVVTLGYRPLHLHELCLLVGMPKQQHGFDDLENIIAICGSFLTIRDDHVYLGHQSAKDYLSDNKGSAAVFPAGHITVHHRIYQESLQNLSTRL
ncbi:hypothetical protein BJX66DRAFT_147413 [Aspergillus keveii]|uniref:Nephrocystin 3-like N-terminal domain-containing protein n=1 Tax=Aspergillus keveii TaxID=714993 RepID=A0ABR4FI66_9EURO